MADEQELSIEEILASIRNILWEKEVSKNASRSLVRDYGKENDAEVFELTKDMIVKGWALPYEYSNWNFDDVAAKILHKFAAVFAREEMVENPQFSANRTAVASNNDEHPLGSADSARVMAKEES